MDLLIPRFPARAALIRGPKEMPVLGFCAVPCTPLGSKGLGGLVVLPWLNLSTHGSLLITDAWPHSQISQHPKCGSQSPGQWEAWESQAGLERAAEYLL